LIRFETNGPAIWFKATGEPNLREFPITVALAKLLPQFVPTIVAVLPASNGWLSWEVYGSKLDETGSIQDWQVAAGALARLQIASIGRQEEILNAGARNLKLSEFPDLVDPFFDALSHSMERQTNTPPAILNRTELLLLREQLHQALSSLEQLEIPNTVGHLDLNPGNIIVSKGECVFLDWAEAYVGHPFFSLEYILQHLRRSVCQDPALEVRIASKYIETWQTVTSTATLIEALATMPMLAVFAYALAITDALNPGKLSSPCHAGYLRALARRMKREADRLKKLEEMWVG